MGTPNTAPAPLRGRAEPAIDAARALLDAALARAEGALQRARRQTRRPAGPTVMQPGEATLENMMFADGPLIIELTPEQEVRANAMDARIAAQQHEKRGRT
jgi:hypothetical protein